MYSPRIDPRDFIFNAIYHGAFKVALDKRRIEAVRRRFVVIVGNKRGTISSLIRSSRNDYSREKSTIRERDRYNRGRDWEGRSVVSLGDPWRVVVRPRKKRRSRFRDSLCVNPENTSEPTTINGGKARL